MATIAEASAARQGGGTRLILAHPLVLRLATVAVVCRTWEYAGRCRSARPFRPFSRPWRPSLT